MYGLRCYVELVSGTSGKKTLQFFKLFKTVIFLGDKQFCGFPQVCYGVLKMYAKLQVNDQFFGLKNKTRKTKTTTEQTTRGQGLCTSEYCNKLYIVYKLEHRR